MKKLIKSKNFDTPLLVNYFFLLLFGWVAIYAATTIETGNSLSMQGFYMRQLIWISISLTILFAIILMPINYFEMMSVPLFILCLIFLIVVMFFPPIKGSHRWIRILGLQFQPSELMKIGYVFMLSKILEENKTEWKIIWKTLLILILSTGLIVIEPNLSATFVYFVITFAMLSFSKISFHHLVMTISPFLGILFVGNLYLFIVYIFCLGGYLLWKSQANKFISVATLIINILMYFNIHFLWGLLKEYQQNRILVFFDPSKDPLGAGYQVIQSKITVGSGGLLGKGFLQGTQKNLSFLPESHNDFIFSVICEEMGFIGALALLSLFFFFFYRIIKLTSMESNKKKVYLNIGFLTFLFYQFFVNISATLGIMPSTGVSLPFISYGGSNLIIASIAVAYIIKRPKYKIK